MISCLFTNWLVTNWTMKIFTYFFVLFILFSIMSGFIWCVPIITIWTWNVIIFGSKIQYFWLWVFNIICVICWISIESRILYWYILHLLPCCICWLTLFAFIFSIVYGVMLKFSFRISVISWSVWISIQRIFWYIRSIIYCISIKR